MRLTKHAAKERAEVARWRTTLWAMPGVRDVPFPWGSFIGLEIHLANDRH
jgi:hypothetical protein